MSGFLLNSVDIDAQIHRNNPFHLQQPVKYRRAGDVSMHPIFQWIGPTPSKQLICICSFNP